MDRRVTVVVALFVGAIALLGTWLLLSSDASVRPTEQAAKNDVDAPAATAGVEGEKGHDLATSRRGVPADALDRRPKTVDDLRRRGINVDRIASPVSSSSFTLDSDGVAAAVASRRAGLDACYATARLHTPDLPAEQSLTVRVEPKSGQTWGTITSVQSAGGSAGSVFDGCVSNVLGEIRFQDVTEAATLTVPVALEAPDP